jgi:hypothetical protein
MERIFRFFHEIELLYTVSRGRAFKKNLNKSVVRDTQLQFIIL